MAQENEVAKSAVETGEAGKKAEYVRMAIPKGFAHPYTATAKDGKEYDKAIVNIPKGAKANGIDLSGYSMDCFLNSYQMSQIANGKALTVSMREDKPVELFKGSGEDRKTFKIDPWALTSAVKEARENYAADKAAERAAAKEAAPKEQEASKSDKGYSLGSQVAAANEAKEAPAASDPARGGQER